MKIWAPALGLVSGLILGFWLGDRHQAKTQIADTSVLQALQALEQRVIALQTSVALGEERCLAAINQIKPLPKPETATSSPTVDSAISPRSADSAADRLTLDRGYDLLSRAEKKSVWDSEDQRAWARLMSGASEQSHKELMDALIVHFKDGSLRPTRH